MSAKTLPKSRTPAGLDPSRLFDGPEVHFFREWFASLANSGTSKGEKNAELSRLGNEAAAEMYKLGASVADLRVFWALWANYMGSGIPPALADQWYANSMIFLKEQVGSSKKAMAELADKANAWLRSTSPLIYLYIGGDPTTIDSAVLKQFRADAMNFANDPKAADRALAALGRMKGLGNHGSIVRIVVRLYLAAAAAPRNPASSYSRTGERAEPGSVLYRDN